MKQEENRPMDKLKSDYESIPVPTEAKERMLAGIAQAKKEQKGVIIMNSVLPVLLPTVPLP